MDNLLDQVRTTLKATGKDAAEIETSVKEIAEKCGMDYVVPTAYAEPPPPFGGATSFDEIDGYLESANLDMHVSMTMSQFEAIVRNVLSRDDLNMAEKGSLISGAANDLQSRVDEPPPMMKEGKGLLGRLFGTKRDIPTQERDQARDSDFAGPNRSFPILKPSDVSAAVSSMGRSKTDPETLKRNIVRIAKRKGPEFVAKLPDSWNTKETPEGGSFTVYKGADGRDRWLAVYSNNFYDRDGEVFTEDAHKEYIDWVDRSGRYPELWLWHTPGSKVGKADVLDYQDGLAIASGTFDPSASDVAVRLMQSKGLGVSHGYRYEKERLGGAGDYRQYRTFEISPLPLTKAANEGTLFLSEGEIEMELTKEKRAFLVGQMGEDRVARIESNLGTLSKELKESGVAWKDFSESVAETPPAAAAAEGSSPPFDQKPNANAGGVTPTTETPAAATTAEDQAKAFRDLVTSAVKDAIDERLQPIEAKIKELDGSNNTPRYQPNAQRPSESNPPLHPNNAMAKEAADAFKETNGDEDPMAFYRKAFSFGAMTEQPVGAPGSTAS